MKKAKLRDLAFYATLLLGLQGHDVRSKWTNLSTTKPQKKRGNPWIYHKLDVNAVQSGFTSNSSVSTKRVSRRLVVALDAKTKSVPSDAVSAMIASLEELSIRDKEGYCRVCLSKTSMTLQSTYALEDKWKIFTRFWISIFKQFATRANCTNSWGRSKRIFQ